MTDVFVLVGAFTALMALPFVPGIIEVRWPRDDSALEVVQDNTKEPRHFGMSLRARLEPYVAQADELPAFMEIRLRKAEALEVHDTLIVPKQRRTSSILVARRLLEVGTGASIGEAYGMGDVVVHDGAHIRGLAVDGSLRLGRRCKIERWIDSEGPVEAGDNCDLGVSASSALSLTAAEGCTFQRLWGMPVSTSTSVSLAVPPTPFDGPSAADSLVWSRDVLSLPPGTKLTSDVVVHGDLYVGSGSVIEGDVKVHGSMVLAQGGRVAGNVVSRKALTIGPDCTIEGNLFAERDIEIGARATVGRAGAYKTVYSSRNVRLSDDVRVFGWVVAEAGGRVA